MIHTPFLFHLANEELPSVADSQLGVEGLGMHTVWNERACILMQLCLGFSEDLAYKGTNPAEAPGEAESDNAYLTLSAMSFPTQPWTQP